MCVASPPASGAKAVWRTSITTDNSPHAPDNTPQRDPEATPDKPLPFATALAAWNLAYIALQSAEAEAAAASAQWERDNPRPALAWVNRAEWEAASEAPSDAMGVRRYPVARLSTAQTDIDAHGQICPYDANRLWTHNFPVQVDALPVAALYTLKTMGQIPAKPPAPVKALLDWQSRSRDVCDGFTESVLYPAADVEHDALDAVLRAPALTLRDLHAKALLIDYAARLGDYTGELVHRDQYFADLARLLPAHHHAALPLAHAQSQVERRGIYDLATRQAEAERARAEVEGEAA